ncbi:MAG: hypothetical protein GY713_17775 [Actinomycetia bacterium]|nr:hypothetical protein [Actinomycetes bacterium]
MKRFLAQIRAFLPAEDRRRVTVSTAHKYKGLERGAVLALDALEGSYPLIHPTWILLRVFGDSLDKHEEEERRLFQAAVTRSTMSPCLVTEQLRTSPDLSKIGDAISLPEAPWLRLPPRPLAQQPTSRDMRPARIRCQGPAATNWLQVEPAAAVLVTGSPYG